MGWAKRNLILTGLVGMICLTGCRKEIGGQSESSRVTFPGVTVRTERAAHSPGIEEVSLLSSPGDELICRVITDKGRVVSILSTPIGSDDIHSYGGFRPVGNGWVPVLFLDLAENGKLSMGGKKRVLLEGRRLNELMLMESRTPIYLTVQQNAQYSNLLAVVQMLASRTNVNFGVGWKARYPDIEDMTPTGNAK